MTAEEVSELKEGDVIYWATGKEHFKGIFVKFTGNVLDLRLMLVRSDDGFEDEILHPFLTSEDIYNNQMAIKNRVKAPRVITQKVQSSIVKKEKVSDESEESDSSLPESIGSVIEDYVENVVGKVTKVPPQITGPISKDKLVKASGHRDYIGGVTPNLKTLQSLMSSDGIHIERDKAKWVRYHLVFSDGTVDQFDFSGKVFELYNIYLDGGIDAILKLKK